MTEFQPFPKVPWLSREMVITEKLDGTNASVWVHRHGYDKDEHGNEIPGTYCPFLPDIDVARVETDDGRFLVRAGSRKRFVMPGKETDNFGFAAWVRDNAEELVKLGPGVHYGEWWGQSIQRGYGLTEKRFSLFNVGRWCSHPCRDRCQFAVDVAMTEHSCAGQCQYEIGQSFDGLGQAPTCCHVVPILYRGPFCGEAIETFMRKLEREGSVAAPGFMNPEGIMIYHTAARQMFKKTFEGDAEGKERSFI